MDLNNREPSTSNSIIDSSSASTISNTIIPQTTTETNVFISSKNHQNTSDRSFTNYEIIEPVLMSLDSIDTSSNYNDESSNMIFDCSMCQKKGNYKHDCCEYNIEISTCLVPNCNVMSRSMNDILLHFRHHMAVVFGENLCRVCRRNYQLNINKMCSTKSCGSNNIVLTNVFKCHECNIVCKTMIEFASHKLKFHDCILKDSTGKYVCLHCKMSSIQMTLIVTHSKTCSKNRIIFEDRVPGGNVSPHEITTTNSF